MSNLLTKTATEFKTESATDSRLMNLPIMKHFSAAELKLTGDMKPGAKVIYNVIAAIVVLIALYGTVVYALPTMFIWLGKILAIGITLFSLVVLWYCRGGINRWLKNIARNLHKAAIKQQPFLPLENKAAEQIENKKQFQISEGLINQIKEKMKAKAIESEKEANRLQEEILKARNKAKDLKAQKEAMVAKDGLSAKDTDEYVELDKNWLLMSANGSRLDNKYQQEKDFTVKYGSRAASISKLSRKLVLVGASIDIKIDDFAATIDILKKDYDYVKTTKEITQAAKDAMLFTTGWEVDYALEVVNNTIAFDIATTSSNLKDIDNYANTYAVDSDELYANLEKVADKISLGEDVAPSARKYNNPDYKLTSEDKVHSGGLESIF